jgi:phage terminase large subunit-like protein
MIPADDPYDESCWAKANPNIGITPKWDFMREQAARSKREPDWKSNFLRFHCNIQVESKIQLINPNAWAENVTRTVDWSKAEQVCGAFDFGWRDDLSAFGAVGRFREGERVYYVGEVRSFICENNKRNLNGDPWLTWIQDGWLTRTDGNTTDFALIKRELVEFANNIGCKQWRFDAYSARQFATELVNDEGLECFEFKQTVHAYHEPLIEFIAAVNDKNMLHLGDPLLAWTVGNVVGRENQDGKMMPDRKKSKDKIDPFVVLVMAFSGARPISDELPKTSDFYESNTLEVF